MKRNLLLLLALIVCFNHQAQVFTSVQTHTFTVYQPTNITFTLTPGISYKLQMSGIWGDYNGSPHYDTRYFLNGTDWGYNYFINSPAWLNTLTPTPAAYDPINHTYDLLFTGDGSTVTISYYDNAYNDNYGAVKFELFEVCNTSNSPITKDTSVCGTPYLTLTASGANNYTWYNAAVGGSVVSTNSTLIIPSLLLTDTFFVSTTFYPGCESNRDTLIVTSNPIPVVNFSFQNASVCLDDALIILNGSPSGGIYTGSGVNATTFNPSTLTEGIYSVIYNYTDNKGCSSSDTSSVEARLCTGLNQHHEGKKIEIFPNPVIHDLNISSETNTDLSKCKLFNLQGIQLETNFKNGTMDVSNLPSGIYFIELENQMTKFIKQ